VADLTSEEFLEDSKIRPKRVVQFSFAFGFMNITKLVTITILDIIHRPVLIKTQDYG
jgi:hypothetical protein